MDSGISFFISLGLFWIFIYSIHKFLVNFFPHVAQSYLTRNISVSYYKIGWETDVYNKPISRFALRWKRSVHFWFSFGAAFGIFILVFTVCYILPKYIISLFTIPVHSQSIQLKLIIPGVTIPLSYFGHVIIAVFLTLAFHELGHALAGSNESQAIDKIGALILMFLPTAYVSFKDNHYSLSAWKQLKIYCAGAFHNFILYLVCTTILNNGKSIVSPFYLESYHGITVSQIKYHEQFSQIQIGDKIVGLNSCSINSFQDWTNCIEQMISYNFTNEYLCYPKSEFELDLTKSNDCCKSDYRGPFPCWKQYNENTDNSNDVKELKENKICKPASIVWKKDVKYCQIRQTEKMGTSNHYDDQNGQHHKSDQDHITSSSNCGQKDQICMNAFVQDEDAKRGIMLLQVRVERSTIATAAAAATNHKREFDSRNANDEKSTFHVFYVFQNPIELYHQYGFNTYEPRWNWMPGFMNNWADTFLLVFSLLSNFNLVTSFVTLLPVYAFDGEYTLYAMSLLLFPRMDEDLRENIVCKIRNVITGIVAAIFMYAIFSNLKWN